MRQFLVAAVMVAASVPGAAQAAIFVRYDVFAKGTITTYRDSNPVPTIVQSSGEFSGEAGFDVSDLAIGESRSFAIGPNANAGVRYGTITRTGFDSWGNAAFTGTDFAFLQDQLLGTTGIRTTRLTAERFTVRQVFPAPVPEPTTWAMMVLGFGVAGYALRRRTLRFRLA